MNKLKKLANKLQLKLAHEFDADEFFRALKDYDNFGEYSNDNWKNMDYEQLLHEGKKYQAKGVKIPTLLLAKIKLMKEKMFSVASKKEDPNHQQTRGISFKNYDLYGDPEGNETSPGTGLFQNMHKFKSIKDFLDKTKKRPKHLVSTRIYLLKNLIQKYGK